MNLQHSYSPSWFLAMMGPRENTFGDDRSSDGFQDVARLDSDLTPYHPELHYSPCDVLLSRGHD